MDPRSTTLQEDERSLNPLEVDSGLVSDIADLVDSGHRGMVLNLVTDLYPADLARLLTHLSSEGGRVLFGWLSSEQAGQVLAELDDEFRTRLLQDVQAERVAELLGYLEADDAADVLADLPEQVVSEVLPRLGNSEEVQSLLGYDEESAGGIMSTEFVIVPDHWTVAEATEEVRRNAEAVEAVFAVFAYGAGNRLAGVVSLKDLLLTSESTPVSRIMDEDVITVTPEVDQEEVARIMQRYDLVSLPVVNGGGRMLGRITIDDVVDVIRDEAEEDIQLMSGMSGSEEPSDSVFRIVRSRLPWLLVGMVGAGLSGLVIGQFDHALEQAVVLATFIPIVMAMAGNAGIQSSAIVVQGLASGDLWLPDVARRIGKELSVSILNGVVLAAVLGAVVLALPLDAPSIGRLAFTASLSMLTVIVLAAVVGAAVPLLLARLDIDPALATGAFITTSNDLLGLAVFFLLATLIYL